MPFLLLEGGNWGARWRDLAAGQHVTQIEGSAEGHNHSGWAKWLVKVVGERLQSWSVWRVGDCLPPGLLDGTGFWTVRVIPEVKED